MALRCALALVLCTGCFFKPDPPSGTGSGSDSGVGDGGGSDAADAPDAAWLPSYTRRRRLRMTRPTNPPGALADFPVSVLLPADDDLRVHAQSENDFIFTAADGVTPLVYEIRRFALALGALEAWVQLPSLPVGTTDMFLYYGGPQVMSPPSAVWGSSYGVWHMDTVGDEDDVMGNVNALTGPTLANTPGRGTGVVGFGREYDTDDSLCRNQANVLPVESKAFSFSMWVETGAMEGSSSSPFSRGGTDNSPGFAVVFGSAWNAIVTDGIVTATLDLGNPSASWTHIAVAVDNPNDVVTTYVNGTQQDSMTASNLGALGQASTVCIGSSVAQFKGTIDEVRVWDGALPAAWFATEHLNLATRATFMAVADVEAQ